MGSKNPYTILGRINRALLMEAVRRHDDVVVTDNAWAMYDYSIKATEKLLGDSGYVCRERDWNAAAWWWVYDPEARADLDEAEESAPVEWG